MAGYVVKYYVKTTKDDLESIKPEVLAFVRKSEKE